jgi:hypothetical protein
VLKKAGIIRSMQYWRIGEMRTNLALRVTQIGDMELQELMENRMLNLIHQTRNGQLQGQQRKTLAVLRAGAKALNGFAVGQSAVALILAEAVTRVNFVQSAHFLVPGHLGQH